MAILCIPARVDRYVLYDVCSREINRLILKGCSFDWAVKVVSGSTISITSGARAADLPSDFGNNFIRYSGPSGDRWLCKLVATAPTPDVERDIFFKSPAQLYDADFTDTNTAAPTWYTIITKAATPGTKQIVVDRLTDQAYQVRGVYVPSGYNTIDDGTDNSILNGLSSFMETAVLKYLLPANHYEFGRINAEHEDDVAALMMEQATNRRSRIIPMQSMYGYGPVNGGGI